MSTSEQGRVLVYSVSTDAFFNDKENEIASTLMKLRVENDQLKIIRTGEYSKENYTLRKNLKNEIELKVKRFELRGVKITAEYYIDKRMEKNKKRIKKLKPKLNKLLQNEESKSKTRTLRRDHLYVMSERAGKEVKRSSKVVALFESSFTRKLELSKEEVNEEVVIVKAYHYDVLENLMKNGFLYDGKEYKFFSSSAGQMKNKKCVFVKKDLLEEKEGALICGLTWERINNTDLGKGEDSELGINLNKYLAYLSLQNTATKKWEGFKIDRVVVCPDLEMDVEGEVEFIDRETYKISPIEKKILPMNVSDGVGLIMPVDNVYTNFQFRIPWGKGLLTSYDFRKHAKQLGKEYMYVTDVWGDTHHVNDVDIILSASQLKTWKYYKNMKEYRQLFKDNNCEAGICNEETETRDYITLSYQHLQSLSMTNEQLSELAERTNEDLRLLGSKKEVMLDVLGATPENEKKNPFQKSLFLYNNLLNDSHAKEAIKSKKGKMVVEALAGDLKIKGKRKFVLPDIHGYCEYLLTNNDKPDGLLEAGQVFAKDIDEGLVDIMRSPALYREHGISDSVKSAKLIDWYRTGAIYVSNKNFLARLLQMDFDGDTVTVSTQKDFNSIVKESMKGIVPLYYEMSTAPIQQISSEAIFESLKKGFGTSIGSISNEITKVWNSGGGITEDKLRAVKLLTMYNNFMIDYCKTNFLPKPKEHVKKEISKYTKGSVPYFFKYAKGKTNVKDRIIKEYRELIIKNQVNIEIKDTDRKEVTIIKSKIKGRKLKVVARRDIPLLNRLSNIIKNNNLHFRKVADEFDYTMLQSVKNFEVDDKKSKLNEAIIEEYKKINKNKKWLIDKECDDYKENKYVYMAKLLKDQIYEAAKSVDSKVKEDYIINYLVFYLHKVKPQANKKTLWECYGHKLYQNLLYKLEGKKICKNCREEFKAKSHRDKYCSDHCSEEGEKIKKAKYYSENSKKK
ncbi:RNA dependent RNA polymerase [Bacillus infantis]|uniref:RNA dependent RNA polymerase n=1 Tax=Bacillus infantis TaxID=324767 RepID=UPI003CF40B72